MKIAVVGADSNVGREVLNVMAGRDFPVSYVVALGKRDSLGREISYGEDDLLKIDIIDDYDFKGTDLAIFIKDSYLASTFVPKALKAGAFVIDASSEFALEPNVPLLIAGVNDENILQKAKKGIIATASPNVVQLMAVLKPIADNFGLKRAGVTTYQATASFGKEAMDELFNQTRGIYMNAEIEKTKNEFHKQIAFNVIPFIDSFMADGQLREEWKIVAESEKILGSGTKINANCAVVPTFMGSSQYVNIETKKEVSPEQARAVLAKAEGVTVFDHHKEEGYATPAEIAGEDTLFVSRIRKETSVPYGVSLFSVADTLRFGFALNIVKLAETVIDTKFQFFISCYLP